MSFGENIGFSDTQSTGVGEGRKEKRGKKDRREGGKEGDFSVLTKY